MSFRWMLWLLLACLTAGGCGAAADRLPPHARDALRNATSVQDVLDARTAPQVAAASCKMYTGWMQLDADARVALAKMLTEHLQRFTADSDAQAVRVIKLTSELINSSQERHRDLTDKLAGACKYLS